MTGKQNGTHLEKSKHNWLTRSHLIFMFCTLENGHMLTDICTEGRCIFVWFLNFGTVTAHKHRCRNNSLRKYQFILASCAFGISLMLTDSCTLGQSFFLEFLVCVAWIRACVGPGIIHYESIGSFSRFVFMNLSYAYRHQKSMTVLLCLLSWSA